MFYIALAKYIQCTLVIMGQLMEEGEGGQPPQVLLWTIHVCNLLKNRQFLCC